jgi:6-pyruvoyltetrahydropterin/6-carboxytetrahydropterin synthase
MTYTVCKEFSFDAAHELPLHDGKCRNLHGHTYRVAVTVSQDSLIGEGPKSGMVIDFGDLQEIWDEKLKPLVDHQYLNAALPVPHTTAEMIAAWMLEQFREHLGPYPGLTVKVWETPSSWAVAS